MKKEGLIYPGENEPRSWDEVNRNVVLREINGLHERVPLKSIPVRDLSEWHEVMKRRASEREEVLGIPESVEVSINSKSPILLALIGDIHAGSEETDYERFAQDIDLIKSVNGFTITVGDLTDSFFFNSGQFEAIANNAEQQLYMQAVLEELAKDGHLLAGVSGDHDSWPTDKQGVRALYHDFMKNYDAHYLEGISYITLHLNDIDYKLAGAHRAPGYSIYNQAHAPLRLEKDAARGTDIAFTAHNHQKAYLQQTIQTYGGEERDIHLLSLGAYKKSDRYSRKHGWPRRHEKNMGAFGLILHPDSKEISVHWTLDEAVKQLERLG
jgi:UDP-2,3-diacylglucosamine pyrophosphatase LpxH